MITHKDLIAAGYSKLESYSFDFKVTLGYYKAPKYKLYIKVGIDAKTRPITLIFHDDNINAMILQNMDTLDILERHINWILLGSKAHLL
jgi:hypothetical protein